MPFANCPNCGQSFHLHLKDTPVWPDKPHQEKALLCPGCWLDVKVGDQVFLIGEKPLKFHPDNLGTVLEKIESDSLTFRVQFGEDRTELLTRDKIYVDPKHRFKSTNL
jgi:hypothetical protein